MRISLKRPNSLRDLASMLGHELQYALEVAAAPEVRDAAGLRSLYLRIGNEGMGEGYYETRAALAVQRQVATEVEAAGCRTRR